MSNCNAKLFDYIKNSPTAYHACAHTAETLEKNGYIRLYEDKEWAIESGKGYFVTRNGSSLIAFRVPKTDSAGFMITASHGDSPCLKIKENSVLEDKNYVRLSTEVYGGMIMSSWFDRPLSIAGRACVKTEKGIEIRLADSKTAAAIIPNVAIHMNRNANSGMNYNASVDLIPLFGGEKEKGSFKAYIASLCKAGEEDILSTDLYLYNPMEGYEWASFISAPRLDDLQCAYSTLEGFLNADEGKATPVFALFDNEEVGSRTKQGAASTFLRLTLERICKCSDKNIDRELAVSMMLSCDNAHAAHPNHPEYCDKNHTAQMNGGIVIKYNANQSYTSDAVSAALFKLVCENADVPVQYYANRADMAGGSTLGNIANTQVAMNTVDIGLAQLAMHSSLETAGKDDTEYMVKAVKAFYGRSLEANESGYALI